MKQPNEKWWKWLESGWFIYEVNNKILSLPNPVIIALCDKSNLFLFFVSHSGRLNANVNKLNLSNYRSVLESLTCVSDKIPTCFGWISFFQSCCPPSSLPSGICPRLIVLWFIGWQCVSSTTPPNSQIYNYLLLLPYMNAISPASLLKRDMGHLSL